MKSRIWIILAILLICNVLGYAVLMADSEAKAAVLSAWEKATGAVSTRTGMKAAAAPVAAAFSTITVTTRNDEGAGGTYTNTSKCSLREAILAAQNNVATGGCAAGSSTGTDLIQISLVSYPEAGADRPSIQAQNELPTITTDLDIVGVSSLSTTIERSHTTSGQFRVLTVDAGATVRVEKVTIQNGLGNTLNGVGIKNSGNLTLDNVRVQGNNADATNPTGAGAIHNVGTLTVINSDITSNLAGNGGGIFNQGTLNMTTSVIGSNNSTVAGGANRNGGGLYNAAGGVATITRSAIRGNSAYQGGGIYNTLGTLTLTNCSLSENSATNAGAAVFNDGIVNLRSVTLGGNGTGTGTASHDAAIYLDIESELNYRNTIFADSKLIGAFQFTNVFNFNSAGFMTSEGHNISNDSTVDLDSGLGDLPPDTDPLIDPIGTYGTATENPQQIDTFRLRCGSPAIDAAWPTDDPDFPSPSTDARGVARYDAPNIAPNGSNYPDIGSHEFDFRIATNSPLPNYTANIPYTTTLVGAGGVTSGYFWQITAGSLPPNMSLNDQTGVISGTSASGGTFTFTVSLQPNILGEYDDCAVTKQFTLTGTGGSGTAPMITPATLSRQQGSPASGATIATVSDAETAAGSLIVTQVAGGTATGITLTGITNTNGTITAQVAASCTATSGTVCLQVSDGSLTAKGNLTVNVTANSVPTLGTYANTSVTAGSGTTVTPSAAPSDNGSVASVTVAGAAGVTVNSAGVVTIPNTLAANTYTVTVTATDNCGATATASFTLTVNAGNTAPTITGSTVARQQGSPAGLAVTIATVNDAETAAGSLTVTQIAGGTATGITLTGITNTNGTITALVAASCSATSGTVCLQVSDGSATAKGNLTVNVTANSAPTLGTYANTSVTAGNGTTVTPSAPPADNGSVASVTVAGATGATVNAAGVVTIPNTLAANTYTVTVTATDNCNATATASFTLTVNAANTAPTITGLTVARQQGSPAGAAVAIATVSDAETAAGSLTVTQVAGGTATGITLTGITNTNGTITAQVAASCSATSGTVCLQVSDGSLTAKGNLTVNVTANTAPTLGTYANTSVNVGSVTTVTPSAAPADNGSVASVTVAGAAGAIVNSAGVVTIPNTLAANTYTVTVTATDNCGATATASFSLTVSVANTAPTITGSTVARQKGSPAGTAVTIATVNDAQSSAGSLTVTQIAGGTATGITVTGITNANGTITAQVAASCTATAGTVKLRVSDGSLTTDGDLTITLTNNDAPVLTYNTPDPVSLGASATVNPATGPSDNGSVSSIVLQSVAPVVPVGSITVNNTTGVVTVNNTVPAGYYTVTVRATDNCGTTTDASFTLNVIGSLLVSEFALSGPNGQNDWFVELNNNTNVPQNTTGLKVGFVNSAGVGYATVSLPTNVLIQPRAYYLVRGSNSSLTGVTADFTAAALPGGFAPAGVALCKGAVDQAASRLDSAGMNNLLPAHLYVEGTAVPWLNNTTTKHAFVRKFATSGFPIDTNNNLTDFNLVAPSTAAINGVTPLLGLPGPQSGTSPAVNNAGMPVALLKTGIAATTWPNAEVVNEVGPGTTRSLYLRRAITNSTGAPVKKLRFRIVEMSTGGVGIANLRAQTSVNATLTVDGQPVLVKGLTLEDAASQPAGGGINSTLCEGTITLALPLAAGAKVNVQFRLGIVSGGSYKFVANVEAQN